MMISPDSFYEYLKGKNAKEIQKEIRSLKIEITKNKKKLENQWTTHYGMCPSEATIIECSREYLELAKKALAEAGGEYIETYLLKRKHPCF